MRARRLGKAVRSPAKDTLLSHASTRTGGGTAFGVHQAMDQAGALAGPLLPAAVLSQHEGNYRLAFGVLIVPAVIVLALLLWLRYRVPDPAAYEVAAREGAAGDAASEGAAREGTAYEGRTPAEPAPHQSPDGSAKVQGRHPRVVLPLLLKQYIGAVGLLSLGIASFPLLAFHAQTTGLLTPAQVPVLFALAMMVDGVSGLLMGRLYDRRGPKTAWACCWRACSWGWPMSRASPWWSG